MNAAGFLNARQAAAYVGYNVAPERAADGTRNTNREDPGVRAFYAWATSHNVKKHRRGRSLLFRRVDLDRAIGASTDAHDDAQQSRLDRMAEMGRQFAGEIHA